MRGKLTAPFVESVKAPEHGQNEYWDGKTPGFGLRVSQGGRKAWVLLYRYQGRKRRLTLGTYPIKSLADARDLAKVKLAQVQDEQDPATQKQDARDADTFAVVAKRYLSEWAARHKRPASMHEDEKMLGRELLPAWGARKAGDISRREVIALVDGIAARAPIAANRVLSLASKIFNFAVSKEMVELNPAYRVPKPGKEQQRSRTLSDDEIVVVWRALEGETRDMAALFKVLLLTGQRRGEVLAMRRGELDLKGGWWAIPGEHTKNGREHRVPLVGRALSILEELSAGRGDSDLVFPGRVNGRPIVNVAKPLARTIRRAGVVSFAIHDLRRTAATGLARNGIPTAVISKLLNHVSGDSGVGRITQIYNRYDYDKEKRDALIRWDAHIAQILRPDKQEVAIAS